MELAKGSCYAIRGLVFLAQRDGCPVPVMLREIAEATGAPKASLAKVFHTLRSAKIVRLHRGHARGYSLAHDPADISAYDIVVATNGRARLHTGQLVATEAGSPFGRIWEEVEELVADRLRAVTLGDLAADGQPEWGGWQEIGIGCDDLHPGGHLEDVLTRLDPKVVRFLKTTTLRDLLAVGGCRNRKEGASHLGIAPHAWTSAIERPGPPWARPGFRSRAQRAGAGGQGQHLLLHLHRANHQRRP